MRGRGGLGCRERQDRGGGRWCGGLGDNCGGPAVPSGADRSLAVSDGGGGGKIGYVGAGVHSAMVLLLSYLWNLTRTDAPSGSLGQGTRRQ